MALVQFKDEINRVTITRRMFPPKKVESLMHWLKSARKVIPEIPDVWDSNAWQVINTQMSVKWITWEISDHQQHRCYVVIDRKADSIGV